jgi:uncharacterized cupin superfamily protein
MLLARKVIQSCDFTHAPPLAHGNNVPFGQQEETRRLMTDIQALALTVAREVDILGPLPNDGPRAGANSGDPYTGTQQLYADENARCGIWECTPGGWDVEHRVGTETMIILKGRVRITTKGEAPVDITAGDVFVLPEGWSGRWETVETVRKFYTIA